MIKLWNLYLPIQRLYIYNSTITNGTLNLINNKNKWKSKLHGAKRVNLVFVNVESGINSDTFFMSMC